MTTGKFLISLDTELAWGWMSYPDKRLELLPQFREGKRIIAKLHSLFEQYDTPVTWALVGRLVDDSVESGVDTMPEFEEFFPGISNKSIYNDKKLHNSDYSVIYFKELVDLINSGSVLHDIGTHTYSHMFLGHCQESFKNKVKSDIETSIDVIQRKSKRPVVSLVYPANQIHFLHETVGAGIKVVRGANSSKYAKYSVKWRRLLDRLDTLLPSAVSLVKPYKHSSGLVFVPGSQLFRVSSFGLRRFIPISLLSRKAEKSLNACSKSGELFHLWFHPFNFAYREDEHFRELETVLKRALELRKQGKLDIVTMADFKDIEFSGG